MQAPVSALADGTTFLFQTVISPGDPAFTQLLGINNGGTIAGYFGDGTVVPNNGFILTFPRTYTPENFPGSVQTQVVGINGGGETVGFWIDGPGVQHGFTNVAGTFPSGDNPMTTTVTQLLGVNNSGVAAGYWNNAGMVVGFNMTSATTSEGFLENAGVFTFLQFPGSVFRKPWA